MVDRAKQIEYLAKELAKDSKDILPVCLLYNLVQEQRMLKKQAPLPPPEAFNLPPSVDGYAFINYHQDTAPL